ncbi:MAG: carbohydrate ABC transporter permease, partial [Chthoniobacterales bacterium]
SVGGALLINPLAAYALSRFKLPQTYSLLVFFLATIAFPAEVTMIPVFLQLKEFHLLNTFGALVLPTLVNGFSIFLLKGFFDSLPRELYEAAELDGASEFTMFWQITMNLSKPILAVIALGAFVTAYSTFFYALILAPDPRMWTIMVYIFQLRESVDSPVVYASLIITAIPTLLVFIFCQNIILRGIVVPSDK